MCGWKAAEGKLRISARQRSTYPKSGLILQLTGEQVSHSGSGNGRQRISFLLPVIESGGSDHNLLQILSMESAQLQKAKYDPAAGAHGPESPLVPKASSSVVFWAGLLAWPLSFSFPMEYQWIDRKQFRTLQLRAQLLT